MMPHAFILFAQAVPVAGDLESLVQTLIGYPLAAIFLVLYIRAQAQLVTVQKDAAAAIALAQERAAASMALEYQKMAEQRREENAQMRALLFDLARRGIGAANPMDTQPLAKAEIQEALAQSRTERVLAHS